MLELRHFRYFIAVAEELHFGKAAQRLFMTQPPLSMQIRQLEETVGVPLIVRDSRPISLTAAGEVFLIQAKEVLRQSESAIKHAQLTSVGKEGHLIIAVTSASVFSILSQLIATFKQSYPYVSLEFKEMVSKDQIEALNQNDINIGLIRSPVDQKKINIMPVQVEPIVVAIPKGSDLADFESIPVDVLDGTALIGFAPDTAEYFCKLSEKLFTTHNIKPLIVQTATQLHTIIALVAAGLGIALVPESAGRINIENFVLRPLALDSPPQAELCLAWNKNDHNPAISSFLELLK